MKVLLVEMVTFPDDWLLRQLCLLVPLCSTCGGRGGRGTPHGALLRNTTFRPEALKDECSGTEGPTGCCGGGAAASSVEGCSGRQQGSAGTVLVWEKMVLRAGGCMQASTGGRGGGFVTA